MKKLAHQFNRVRFDPDTWLDLAETTGMRCICFTTKPINGFCMWNTAQMPYNVVFAGTVMVVRMEFDSLPEPTASNPARK
jgi:alpha-L-fucosidase